MQDTRAELQRVLTPLSTTCLNEYRSADDYIRTRIHSSAWLARGIYRSLYIPLTLVIIREGWKYLARTNCEISLLSEGFEVTEEMS